MLNLCCNPDYLLLEQIAKNYIPPRHNIPSSHLSNIEYFKTHTRFKEHDELDIKIDPPPLWQGVLRVFSPMEFRNAIVRNAYGDLRENLIALTENAAYRWDYDEEDFISFLYLAVKQNHFNIFLLLYAYLPGLGIKLPKETPIEFIQEIMSNLEAGHSVMETETTAGGHFFLYSLPDSDRFGLSPKEKQAIEAFNPEQVRQGVLLSETAEVPSFFTALRNDSFESMLQKLASQSDNIGEIYKHVDTDSITKTDDPLLALSRLDYTALYAYAKLESAARTHVSPGDHDILGFMPQDESHIFYAFAKLFAERYGSLDAIDCLPTLMPQTSDAETSKLFYLEYGIDELNQLIDLSLVSLQSLLISAITSDNPYFYLSVLKEIISCLSHAEEQNRRTSTNNGSLST